MARSRHHHEPKTILWILFNLLAIIQPNCTIVPLSSQLDNPMVSPWNASSMLVLRAALLVLLTGCGIETNTNAPKPTDPGGSAGAVSVARGGLQLGYAWNADTRNLYPILGVSGAAHYGSGALAPDPTVIAAAAVTAASSSWGLVLHKDGTLEQWTFPASSVTTLADRVAVDSTIVFSPSGNSAALISASTGTAIVVTGLPAKAQIAALALPAGFVKGEVAASDGGGILAGTAHAGTGVQVGVLSETHGYSPITIIQSWGGAGFLPGASGDAAVIADGTSGRLLYASNLNGTSATVVSLSTAGLLQKPVAVGVSPDGKWAYIADSAKPQILRVSIGASSTAPPSAIPCACTLRQMAPLTADGIYSLSTGAQGEPQWLLDTRTSQPKVFFVPAMSVSSGSQLAVSTMKPAGGTAQ
jgi:DNA-binding beta-propeller fold protein YncE